jgi:hypothetical protein
MKIGFIEPHLACCGGIRRILEITNRLAERGHEMTIFLPPHVLKQREVCDWFPVKAKILSTKDIKTTPLDIIVFNLGVHWKLCLESPSPVKVYYILHYDVLYKDANESRDSYEVRFKKLANSNWTADMIFIETGVRPRVVHGGINPKHFYPVDCNKEYDILCYGSPRYWKGTRTIEQAAKILGLKLEKYEGKGIPQEKMGEEYSKARVFVSGSYFEGWNQPGLEALASGIPLVITDDGGSADYAINNRTALVVPPRDPESMAKAIKKILDSRRLSSHLVRNGLKMASQFRWEKTTDRIEQIFNEWGGGL